MLFSLLLFFHSPGYCHVPFIKSGCFLLFLPHRIISQVLPWYINFWHVLSLHLKREHIGVSFLFRVLVSLSAYFLSFLGAEHISVFNFPTWTAGTHQARYSQLSKTPLLAVTQLHYKRWEFGIFAQ